MKILSTTVANRRCAAICVLRKRLSRAMMHLPDICVWFILKLIGLVSKSAGRQNETSNKNIPAWVAFRSEAITRLKENDYDWRHNWVSMAQFMFVRDFGHFGNTFLPAKERPEATTVWLSWGFLLAHQALCGFFWTHCYYKVLISDMEWHLTQTLFGECWED